MGNNVTQLTTNVSLCPTSNKVLEMNTETGMHSCQLSVSGVSVSNTTGSSNQTEREDNTTINLGQYIETYIDIKVAGIHCKSMYNKDSGMS